MLNKKIMCGLLLLLFSTNSIAKDVIYKTYQVAITNHHFSSLHSFTTQGWYESCRCELQLDKLVIKPGETAYGTLISDAEFYCSIRWHTVSLMNEEVKEYKQEIAVDYSGYKNYGVNCEVQQTKDRITIQQNQIAAKLK